MSQSENYTGFELGPIRPPSEARSLLLRITRNCPWNKCTFCGLYKHEKFSIRPVDHVKLDIDLEEEEEKKAKKGGDKDEEDDPEDWDDEEDDEEDEE